MSRSAAAAAGVFLTSCFGRKLSTSPTPRPTYGSSPSSVETRWPIDRVVYFMMENRSFDNLFGRFPGANGARTGNRWGRRCPSADVPVAAGDLAPTPCRGRSCTTTGSWMASASAPTGRASAYTQFAEQDIPNYYQWAKRFVLCDNFFASVAGPSYPNHLFFIAGPGRRRDRQPGEHPGEALQRRADPQELGVRRLRRRRVRQHA